MEEQRDDMWPHFAPLWVDLRAVADGFVLAGGYGLFLKHRWLLVAKEIRTAVSWEAWRDPAPRVTKDLDLIVGLDLIASCESQPKIAEVLERHEFAVVPKNTRWQFEKKISEDRSLLVDFHATIPRKKRADIEVKQRRVKPKPSMGGVGIHCRENPEAIGCDLEPFRFNVDEVEIVVPNPVAWCLMKMIAMRDRWGRSQVSEESPENREFAFKEAQKHAQDVCRAIAMTTRDEATKTEEIAQRLRSETVFAEARTIQEGFFKEEGTPGCEMVRNWWTADALNLIREILSRWFA